MGQSITTVKTIWTTNCYRCGIEFGMPREYYQDRINDGESFCCPNGHSQHFTESTKEKVKRLETRLAAAQQESVHYREQRDSMERSRNAVRGQITRIKNRIHAGMCIHCNRSFENLARHMKCKHSEHVDSTPPTKWRG